MRGNGQNSQGRHMLVTQTVWTNCERKRNSGHGGVRAWWGQLDMLLLPVGWAAGFSPAPNSCLVCQLVSEVT